MVGFAMPDTRELGFRWVSVLGHLEVELGKANREIWLSDSRPLSLDDGVLRVESRREYARCWLNERYRLPVARAVKQVFGHELRVEFVPPEGCGDGAATLAQDAGGVVPVRGPLTGQVNAAYTFESYYESDGNRFAIEACRRLLDGERGCVNPLFVFGEPGMGKTHLLHALAGQAIASGQSTASLTAETFVNLYARAGRAGALDEFQDTVRSVDVLIVDDVQWFSGKNHGKSIDQLSETFDAVLYRGAVLAFGSEHLPREVDLPERLRSRFVQGRVTEIRPFSWQERAGYCETLAERQSVSLPRWAIERIASLESPPVRVLQGATNAAIQLLRRGALELGTLDREVGHVALRTTIEQRCPDRAEAEAVVARLGVSFADVLGPSRAAEVKAARQAAAVALRARGLSLAGIGRVLGRDKSSVDALLKKAAAPAEGGRLRRGAAS